MRPSRRCSPSVRAGSGRRPKRARWGMAAIAVVERATGISRSTIQRGLRELDTKTALPPERTRKRGGGRKPTTAIDPSLLRDLDALVDRARRSRFAAALVLQEHPNAGGRAARAGPCG